MDRVATRALVVICAAMTALFLAACSSDSTSKAEIDETPPTVTGTFPESGDTGISRSGPFWVAFSEPMNELSAEAALSIAPGPVYCETAWRSDTLVVTPTVLFAAGTSYTMTIGGAAEDEHGNALGTDHVVSFTTTADADDTPPQIVSTLPANGAINVNGIQPVAIVWSEPMARWETQAAVAIDPEPATWWVEWESVTMTIYHSAFPEEALITITIGTGARDLSGNNLASPHTLSFTTMSDDTRPYLASASPANGATGVSTGISQILLTFSEPMDNTSFAIPAERVDARIAQVVREEPSWNSSYSAITVPVMRTLLPGCTYWIQFWNVTDGAGNVIDPNPTPYEFTTTGTPSLYPVKNGAVWNFIDSRDEAGARAIENHSPSTGAFDEVYRGEGGETSEVIHLRVTSSAVYHRGRSEYRNGDYRLSMMWNDPILYIRFPLENYLGQSWTFSTTGTIDATRTISLSGRCEIDAAKVNLVSAVLHGTFRGCYVHHLYADFVMYENGIPVDEGSTHQIMWFAPGVGPVQMVQQGSGSSDTLRVYDWSL
jgi:hypothetical protein